MAFNGTSLLKSTALALALTVALPAGGGLLPAPALAATTLPAPYVSRALDSVLLPVDAAVISAFGLAPGTSGVLVLATQPGGLADQAGILPGDVIGSVGKRAVVSPIEVDEVVYYWLLNGTSDFDFGGLRGGSDMVTTTVITMESWESVIEVTEISSWSSYSSESYSYAEYTAEYSEEIVSSYEEASVSIEETVSSETYSEEMTAEESSSDEATAEEAAMDEGVVDEAAGEEVDCPDGQIVDGACVAEEEPLDEAPVEEGGDEGADAGDEEPIEE